VHASWFVGGSLVKLQFRGWLLCCGVGFLRGNVLCGWWVVIVCFFFCLLILAGVWCGCRSCSGLILWWCLGGGCGCFCVLYWLFVSVFVSRFWIFAGVEGVVVFCGFRSLRVA